MFPPSIKIYATRGAAALTCLALLAAAIGITNDFTILREIILVLFVALALYFFLLNYRQLALASFGAGLFFGPFIVSLPRQIWVILDVLAIAGVIYATYWATNPYKKGVRFEDYVLSLFPESDFAVTNRTRDISKHSKRFVESDTYPDFEFRTKDGKVFAVECKWRAKWAYQPNGGEGIWWNLHQWDRYMEFQNRTGTSVYVAFGIGGRPERPNEVYFLELERLRFPFVYKSVIKSADTSEKFVQKLQP